MTQSCAYIMFEAPLAHTQPVANAHATLQIAINIDINWVWFFWEQKKLFSEVCSTGRILLPNVHLGHTFAIEHMMGWHVRTGPDTMCRLYIQASHCRPCHVSVDLK